MHWNHRVVRTVNDETLEVTLQIAEVYYTDKNKPYAYSDPFLMGDTLVELTEILDLLKDATSQPVLAYPGDFDLTVGVYQDDDEDDTPVAAV